MAKEQQLFQRQIQTQQQTVNAGNSFERLGQAAGQVGELINKKATELAVTQAAEQGALDAQKGELPKDLSLPLTPATAAYNKAASAIEADRMVTSAQSQLQQTLVEMTNPATFNRSTPAEFQARLEGIVEGTLDNTRDQNRAQVASELTKIGSKASLQMLQHSIQFDNTQTKHDAQVDLNNIQVQLRDAVIKGDTQQANDLRQQWFETLGNYGDLNNEIARQAPELREQFQKTQTINQQLGAYSKAASEGNSAQFLAEFMQNKENLPFDEWQKAAKELLTLDNTQKKLTNEMRGAESQQVSNAILDGTVQTPGDILLFPNLTITQQLQKMGELQKHQDAQFKQQSQFLQAQNDIATGNSVLVSGDTLNKILDQKRNRFQVANGRPMGILDTMQSVLGQGQFPMSGIEGVPVERNVPEFDNKLASILTSSSPEQVLAGAAVYKHIVDVLDKPKMINLSGDALDIATAIKTLDTGGLTQDERIQQAKEIRESIMFAKEPEREERRSRVNKLLASDKEKKKLFKKTFGVDFVPGASDSAMNILTQGFKVSFMKHGIEQAALDANKFNMKAWSTSKYFQDGMVAQPVPEKELGITQMGFAFDNQIRLGVQELIESNFKDRAELPDNAQGFTIEWVDSKVQRIDTSKLTDEDLVFTPLGQEVSRRTLGVRAGAAQAVGQVQAFPTSMSSPKPRVKINGFETEIYLQPTADSRVGERLEYALFYTNEFGEPQPVPDRRNPSGVARFAPKGLEKFAPGVFESKQSERLRDIAVRISQKQAQREWEELGAFGAKGTGITGITPIDDVIKFQKYPQAAEIFRRMTEGSPEEAEKILRQQIQADPKSQAESADNTGIAADTGQETKNKEFVSKLESIPEINNKNQKQVLDSVIEAVPDTKDEDTKPVDVEPPRKQKKATKKNVIEEIRNMTGSATDDENQQIISKIRTIYPKLNENQAIMVIDNFNKILKR